jgi:hypothetical protein
MARRKKALGASTSLQTALRRTDEKYRGGINPCRVQAGSSVTWEGDLASAQCERFPAGKWIGRGSFASAYEHWEDNRRVVKFTGDAGDAQSSRKLLGQRLKGSVNVLDVARLRGQTAQAPVKNEGGAFEFLDNQPVFAITTERVTPNMPKDWLPAIRGVYNQVQAHEAELLSEVQSRKERFTVPLKYFNGAITYCRVESKNPDECYEKVKTLIEAVDELGQHGVFTPDLHAKNWGMRGDQPVILDFGVSRGDDSLPIDLAKAPQRRRRRARR